MTGALSVVELDVDDAAWRQIVDTATGSSPFHHPRLVRAAASSTGCRSVVLGARRGTELAGGIAAVVSPGGSVLPRSLAAFNGPLVAAMPGAHPRARHRHESTVAGALLDELVRRHPRVSLRMRPGTVDIRGLVERGWVPSLSFTYHLDLSDLSLAWRRVDDNRRRLVRRAEHLGYEVREVSAADADGRLVDRVARLHAQQQASYGTPVELDRAGWRVALASLLGSRVARLFATADPRGDLVAFVLVSASVPSAAVLASGAERSALDDGAAALLRWEVFRQVSGDGVRVLDLNGARSGPHGRFKASFGGELVERWELRSPEQTTVPTWGSIVRRAATGVRSDVRRLRTLRQERSW
ncbi:MAG: hypothetical protein RI958_393 [Actinomycetota bacterium]